MIGSDAYNYINVLSKAAEASLLRNTVITNNLANQSTPGYKRKEIQFETYLRKELGTSGNLDRRVANVNLDQLQTTIYTDQEGLDYRLDGNNVNPDTENANLAQNSIRFNTLLNSINQEFTRLKAVLQK